MLNDRILDDAIRSLKADLRAESLSSRTRSRIFNEITRPTGKFEAFAAFFPRFRSVAAALAFPVALTMALVMSLPGSMVPGSKSAKIVASKVGDDVVFTVANGHSDHRVFKSTDPTRFGVKEVPGVDGRFKDSANNGVDLVFYRVD